MHSEKSFEFMPNRLSQRMNGQAEAVPAKKAGNDMDANDIQGKIAAIASAESRRHVLDVVETHLRRLGATHVLITGLPMPNRPIDTLVQRFRWPDERNGGIELNGLSPDDTALTLGLVRDRPFVWDIPEGDTEDSELCAAARAGNRLVVVPVTEIHPFQALVLGAGPDMRCGTVDLSNLGLLCGMAFHRLIDLGSISLQRPGDLSARERRVLELTALGKTANEIAELLEISQRTVHAHLQNASVKLNASNKTHTVVEAIRYGQIRM